MLPAGRNPNHMARVCGGRFKVARRYANDPALLEPIPRNAIVERFIPQDTVLPHVQATVSHGGSGSMLAALAHGLPMLMLPQGADQFENAEACRSIGAALVLMPDRITAETIRAAMTTLLDDRTYAENAQRVAAEIASMQSPATVLATLTNSATPQPSL